jgi:golgin subfamily B member 1
LFFRYAVLERKFYELAEHNNMLEQSLHERNDIIIKWEEILAHISVIPPHIRDSDPEERIDWLVNMLLDAQRDRDSLQLKIESLEESSDMLIVDLEGSRKRISELNAELAAVRSEKEFFADSLDKLRFDYDVERENMRKQLTGLQKKISEKIEAENEIIRLVDLVRKALPNHDSYEELSGINSVRILEKLVSNLLEERNVSSSMSRDLVDLGTSEENKSLAEEVQKLKGDMARISEKYQKVVGEHESAVMQRDSLSQQLQGFEELNMTINLLEEERANSLKKHQELVTEMEFVVEERNTLQVELQQLQEKQSQEVETLNGRISLLESELELTAGQISTLQEQLSDLHQLQDKHVQEVKFLNGKIKLLEEERSTLQVELQRMQEKQLQEVEALNRRMSSLESELELTVGQRNTLQEQLNDLHQLQDKHVQEVELLNGKVNLLEEERAREPEKHQQLVSELESTAKERNVLQEQLNQVREKLNVAVRKGKGLVQQRDALKQQIETLEVEKSSILTQTEENIQLLDRISTALHTIDAGSLDPIQRVEVILKLNADLKMAVASADAEANKSRRATELLLAELNESQERNDMLQEELESMRKNQMEGLREMSLAVGKLRDSSFEILESMVGKLHKDEEIMSYMEDFVSLLASGIDSLGDSSGYTSSVRLLKEAISVRKVFQLSLLFFQNTEFFFLL